MAHLHLSYYLSSNPTALSEQNSDQNNNCPSSPENVFNCSNSSNGTVELSLGNLPTYISIVSCSFSCLGSLLIFVAYFALKGIRNIAQKIITLLALADFFTASGYLVAGWNYLANGNNCSTFTTVCEVQSFVTSWSSISSFGWTSALALHFYLLLSAKRRLPMSTILVWQNLIIWVFPLAIVLPLLITDKLGYSHYAASNWCFIRRQEGDSGGDTLEVVLILIGGKLWEMLSYIFVVVMYTLTTLKLNKLIAMREEARPVMGPRTPEDTHQTSPQEGSRPDIKQRLLLIPIMFILLRMWGTVQFFYALAKRKSVQEGCVSQDTYSGLLMLSIAQAIGDGGQGWSNALLYIFLSPTIRQQLFVHPLQKWLYLCLHKLKLVRATEEAHGVQRSRVQRLRRDAPDHMRRGTTKGGGEGTKWITTSDGGLQSVVDSGYNQN